MPNNQGFRHHRKQPQQHNKPKQQLDDLSPISKAFREYAEELDDKHDRHERIVKLSRDITIESKRIIFLLHSIDGRKNNKEKVLAEAQERLNKLMAVNFKAIAKELKGHDPYQHRSAYSPGLQEFIEAYTFMEYLKDEEENSGSQISDWEDFQQKMQYEEVKKENKKLEIDLDGLIVAEEDNASATLLDVQNVEEEIEKFEFFVDPSEYILGVSDLTGELMRRCINSLGSGETDICLQTCKVLKQFFTGYISLNMHRFRELSRKIYTMRQSLLKAENVCYNVKVRGGEAAKWGSVHETKSDDIDEGFY